MLVLYSKCHTLLLWVAPCWKQSSAAAADTAAVEGLHVTTVTCVIVVETDLACLCAAECS